MPKEYIESKCGSCVHLEACKAWIQHGYTLYSDFSYSVDGCPHYAPASDVVEVVHGRWEYLQDDEWRCSNCHTVFNTGGKWMPMTDNFCSECGADMRERRDNDG